MDAMSLENDLRLFIKKMADDGATSTVTTQFSHFYREFRSGRQSFITEDSITPIVSGEIPSLSDLDGHRKQGEAALPHTVVVKLNGGLGTTMGCTGPKSLITIKNDLHFLDIAVRQVLNTKEFSKQAPPIVLMNSFNTENASRIALQQYHNLSDALPHSFLQNRFPRIDADTLQPVTWPADPHLEWNPPGHGDIFTALKSSGLLKMMLDRDYRYAFISNSDNVGASLDTALLGYLSSKRVDFLMEVTERTVNDRKGGHIAKSKSGHLLLRELVQCPEKDLVSFQDTQRHRFFNTNNLWIDLTALDALLSNEKGILKLPLLCNRKNIDATDPRSPKVLQLESAMGSALSLFSPAAVINVPRTRFIPVKTSDDLLLLRSDYYTLSDDFRIIPGPDSSPRHPEVTLDQEYFGTVDRMTKRFSGEVPSLKKCHRFVVKGDVRFGKECTITGDVTITNQTATPYTVPDGTVLNSDCTISD